MTIQVQKDALPVERADGYEAIAGRVGDYSVMFERIPAGFPPGGAEAFKGLPDDACQCPHWGFLYEGSFRVSWRDGRSEVVTAGSAYYLPPGHIFEALEDCSTIEFSPAEALERVQAVVQANVERILSSAGGA